MTTSTPINTQKLPPIKCTPCRVNIDGNRWRIYADGSVSTALRNPEDIVRLGFTSHKQVDDHERALPRLLPHSHEARTIRREASRLRRNRNARERAQAMKDLGLNRSPATPGGWE